METIRELAAWMFHYIYFMTSVAMIKKRKEKKKGGKHFNNSEGFGWLYVIALFHCESSKEV